MDGISPRDNDQIYFRPTVHTTVQSSRRLRDDQLALLSRRPSFEGGPPFGIGLREPEHWEVMAYERARGQCDCYRFHRELGSSIGTARTPGSSERGEP